MYTSDRRRVIDGSRRRVNASSAAFDPRRRRTDRPTDRDVAFPVINFFFFFWRASSTHIHARAHIYSRVQKNTPEPQTNGEKKTGLLCTYIVYVYIYIYGMRPTVYVRAAFCTRGKKTSSERRTETPRRGRPENTRNRSATAGRPRVAGGGGGDGARANRGDLSVNGMSRVCDRQRRPLARARTASSLGRTTISFFFSDRRPTVEGGGARRGENNNNIIKKKTSRRRGTRPFTIRLGGVVRQ